MKIDILSLFPQMFQGPFEESIVKRAQEKGLVKIAVHDLRKWAEDKHKTVDDKPYGGGPGMVMRVDVISRAISEISTLRLRSAEVSRKFEIIDHKSYRKKSKIILMTPQGKPFEQADARRLAQENHLLLLAGHYEGVDERVRDLVDEEISIGDYVLTGGELPAMVVVDCVVRLIPGVLGKKESIEEESFRNYHTTVRGNYLLEYPQYTRPETYKGQEVPDILLSGNHAEIKKWREEQARMRTEKRRPDLLRQDSETSSE